MEKMMKAIDRNNHSKISPKEEEVPWKLSRFEDFVGLVRRLALDGSNKYAGAEAYRKEAIDIIPDILGEEGYVNFVLGDLVKRITRFKNQRRERDLVKIALWTYLLWMRLFPKQDREGRKAQVGMD
ncbi:MAG: hypothetical protein WCO26_03350 [Deltaproteobacteria bacterium]